MVGAPEEVPGHRQHAQVLPEARDDAAGAHRDEAGLRAHGGRGARGRLADADPVVRAVGGPQAHEAGRLPLRPRAGDRAQHQHLQADADHLPARGLPQRPLQQDGEGGARGVARAAAVCRAPAPGVQAVGARRPGQRVEAPPGARQVRGPRAGHGLGLHAPRAGSGTAGGGQRVEPPARRRLGLADGPQHPAR